MAASFEELDCSDTELGELVLRRRRPLAAPNDWIYEVKLAGRFLMSSLVADSERALATMGLLRAQGGDLRVLVGGLGLGCTAATVLADPRVKNLEVVERLPAVVEWHRRGLVPLGATLTGDPRCRIVLDDCFARLSGQPPARPFDAVLLDIDDSPADLLDEGHGAFYTAASLQRARRWLRPGGVFGLWTNVPAAPSVRDALAAAFASVEVEEIAFDNPLLEESEVNALYFARA